MTLPLLFSGLFNNHSLLQSPIKERASPVDIWRASLRGGAEILNVVERNIE